MSYHLSYSRTDDSLVAQLSVGIQEWESFEVENVLFESDVDVNGLPDELLKHAVNQELLEQVEECLAWLRKEIKA